MNNCFVDYIGLKGKCDVTPSLSGLYINDAAGIDSEALALLAGKDDHLTLVDVFNRIQTRAILTLQSTAKTKMQSKFIFSNLQDSTTFGKTKSPNAVLPATVLRAGIKMRYTGTKYGLIHISRLRINVLAAATAVAFDIHDANTGQLLDTITTDLIVGENIIDINKDYPAQAQETILYISYVDPQVQTYQTYGQYWWGGVWYDYGGCDCECNGDVCGYAVASGGTFDTLLPSLTNANIISVNETGGLRLDYEIRCSFMNFLCENIEFLTNIYFNILQYEFWKEVANSPRINHLTAIKKEYTLDKMQTLKKEYSEELDTYFETVIIPDDCCFICYQQYLQRTNLP